MLELIHKRFNIPIITMLKKHKGKYICKKLRDRKSQQINRTIKKSQGKLRKENTVSVKAFHLDGFTNWWEMTGEKVNEHKDQSIEIIQSEEQRKMSE